MRVEAPEKTQVVDKPVNHVDSMIHELDQFHLALVGGGNAGVIIA